MTTLDAVNNMLLAVNALPVTILDESIAEVKIALQVLNQTTELVLSSGWHFNTEENIELTPDADGIIHIPLNAIFVDPTDKTKDCIIKDGKLYDKTSHSFVFDGPVKVTIIYNYSFENLPIYAQKYIAEKAARIYIAQTFGDPQLYQYQSQEEIEAYANLVSHELEAGDYNMLNSYRGYING